jgi:hypothetical protein
MEHEGMKHALPATGCVVLLVMLAGCGGILGSETTAPGTSTPADVPTDGPLADPPSGLSESGVTDPAGLASTHDTALNDTSFTYEETQMLTATNGTELVNTTIRAQYPADGGQALINQTYGTPAPMLDGATGTVTQWYNGSAALLRITTAEGTEYGVIPETGVGVPSFSDQLESYYSAADNATVTSDDGSIQLQFTTTAGEEVAGQLPVEVTNRTVTVTMTDAGQIEQYRVEYTGTPVANPETTVEGVRTVEVMEVGTTAPEAPDWLQDARDSVNASG